VVLRAEQSGGFGADVSGRAGDQDHEVLLAPIGLLNPI
jgi:hypothetical protein